MQYYHERRSSDGHTYSVDKCRVHFDLYESDLSQLVADLTLNLNPHIEVYPTCLTPQRWKYMFTFKYESEHNFDSMTVGLCFNGSKREDMFRGFIEFNPNKLGSNRQFWADYGQIKVYMRYPSVKRVDLAIDIPTDRSLCRLLKDQRVYEYKCYSLANSSEYLGVRNDVGRVKLYNKQIESKLNSPLTRLEITCLPTIASLRSVFPKCLVLEDSQLNLSAAGLTGTDMYILQSAITLLNENLDPGLTLFNGLLGRDKKEKLKPFLVPESFSVALDESCAILVFNDFLEHFNLNY